MSRHDRRPSRGKALALTLRSLLLVVLTGLLAAPAAWAASSTVGAAAPDFRLQDQNGRWVTLGEQRGKWLVLYFYPKDNTPGCTTEACEFRDNVFTFREAGATILGVSVDDVESHGQFATEHGLPFPILADAGKTTSRAYGVLYRALGILEVARRETFVIDPQGRIAKHYTQVDPKGHSQVVLADLKLLKSRAR